MDGRKAQQGSRDKRSAVQLRLSLAPRFPFESEHSLEHDDSYGIVEDTLAKDNRVELWIDVQGVEDGEDGDGVGSGER